MSEAGAKPDRRKGLWKYLLVAAVAGLVLLSALAWYATTDSFQAAMRRRLVAELERTSGGRVELGVIHTIPFRLQVDVRDLTIHGREAAGEVPYAHVDRLVARIKIISLLETQFGFDSVVLERPVVHVILYPDGSTNQPTPKLTDASAKTHVERLFSLSIRQLEVRHGELLWHDQKIPLDFVANDVSADMNYSVLHGRYDGSLLFGKVGTTFDGYRPVAWMAEAHFALGGDSLEVKSLRATSGRSTVTGNGRLVNFRRPVIAGQYDLVVDLAEAGAVVRNSHLRHGVLQASGSGSWSNSGFGSTGKLLLSDFDWRQEAFNLHAARLNTQFTLDPQRLSLLDLTAKLLGGEASGNAEVMNWLNFAPAKTTGKIANEQKGTVRLKMRGLSAAEIASALSSAARPLRRMNLAGTVDVSTETRWKGSPRNAETEIALDVTPPLRRSPGELPLEAHTHATYRAGPAELEVSEFNAGTHATQVRASGTLSTHAALKLFVSTSDLGEWQPVLDALGYRNQIPVLLHGHASFTGTATGRVSEVDFAGKLQSQDFEIRLPATSRRPKRQVRWDYLSADVELSPYIISAHNGTLRRGETTVTFDASAGLDERQFTDASPFSASVQVHNVDIAKAMAISGYDYPISGQMDLFLHASGTKAQPQGAGAIHVTNAVLHGKPVQQLDSKFSFTSEQVSLSEIQLVQDQARVTGDGTFNFATQAFRSELHGQNFDLASFPALQFSRVAVDGRMDFDAQSSGTVQEPILNATLQIHDLALDHERVGDFIVDAATQGSELRLSGRSQFNDAELDIDGNVQLRGNWPATVNLHFNHLDVDSVLRVYLRRRVTGRSSAAGDLQLTGPLREPQKLQVAGDISDFFADLEHIQVRNSGPLRFAFSDQSLAVQQFRLIGQGTDLSLAGKVRLNEGRELNLHADGHADLGLIQNLNPDFTSSGAVGVNVAVEGTLERPTILGKLQITHGFIQYRDLPSALSEINGSLVFNQDRLQIETLTAYVGGGLVTFGGYANAYNRQLNFDLTLRGEDVRLRYPPGVSSMATADLRWTGTTAASTLSGNATITKLAVMPGFDFGSYLASTAQASALPQTNPLLNRIRMDVHIVTTPELQMQSAAVRLSGDADLHLRGTAAKPVLLGRADIIEGDVYFNGSRYRMERGSVLFTNPVTTTPVLDLQASTKVRDYDVTLNLTGQLDKMSLSYHSEPPLSTADILNLLALGQTQQQSAQLQQSGQTGFAQQASSAVLAEALNSALSSRSQRLFGISHIRIDPQGLNTETTPTQTTPLPSVTIEQQVRDNLTLSYTTNVADTSQQIIQGEYNITHNLSIVGIRDYNGVVSFEVRFRQRKK